VAPAEGLDARATTRRALLRVGVLAGGSTLLLPASWPGAQPADGGLEPLADACRELYIFGLPALEMARARERTIGARANEFRHVRALASAASRRVTTPNNDTLYSSAWLDLRHGPVELAIPSTGARYFSLALLDMHSNNFHIVGTRVTGGGGHRFRLLPPDANAARGEVRAPTPWVWVQARTLVADDTDLPAAHAVQDALQISSTRAGGSMSAATPGSATAYTSAAIPVATAAPLTQLAAIARLLDTEAPPAPADRALLARLRSLGLTTSALKAAAGALAETQLATAAERGVTAARREIAATLAHPAIVDGWLYSRPSIGNFGTDYLYRASIAVWGLAALPPVEAAYFRAVGPESGSIFDGRRNWRIRFAADRLPPVGAFWSLSLYEAMPSGELFFFDNPLRRYAIGDRTPGLLRGSDSSLQIRISADDPGSAWRSNWLPCPRGPFALVLRAYLPGQPIIDGTYRLPPLEPT
jgi:hypothetical protein